MKKYILNFSASLAFIFCVGMPGNAQVAINTTGNAPVASAMLDVTSTNSGILVPRMTLAQRTAIASPATGLLIFQTDGNPGFYYYTGAAWISLWSFSGNNIGFTGSVAIGAASPNASARLDIISTTSGMLVPRMTQAQRNAIATPATGLLIFQTNSNPGFYYYTGTAWLNLNTQWTYSGTNIAFASGSVGINTAAPTRTLDVNGTARIGTNGTTLTNIIKAAVVKTVGTIAARSTVTTNFAVANAATASSVVISPLNALPANGFIAYARVSAAGNVQVVFANLGAASINLTSNTFYITVIQ